MTGYIEEGRRGGARLALGGGRPSVPVADDGYYVEPTIFVDVTPDMRIAKEEIFGPVLSVLTFEDEDDAIRIANDVMYGLAATVWTTDLGRAFRVADKIDAGIIWTNCPHYLPVNVPYEGHKMSGSRRGPRGRGAPDVHPPQDPLHQLQRREDGMGLSPATHRRPRRDPRPVPPGARDHLPRQRDVRAAAAGDRRRAGRATRDWQAGTGDWVTDWDAPTDQAPRDFARLIGAPEDTIATIPASSVGTGLVAGMLGPGDEVVVPGRRVHLEPVPDPGGQGAGRGRPRGCLRRAGRRRSGRPRRSSRSASSRCRPARWPTSRRSSTAAGTSRRAGHDRRDPGHPVRAARRRHRPDRLPRLLGLQAPAVAARHGLPLRPARPLGRARAAATPTGARRTCRTAATSAGR